MGILDFFASLDRTALIIRCLGYGLVAASVIAFFVSGTTRSVVKKILSAKALSREDARTAAELGLKGPFVRSVLRDRSSLRKTVRKTEADGGEARFYIPEEKADGAEIRYVKRSSLVLWIIGTLLLAAATEAAVRLVPMILGSFN
ncbi:MAG: hypothetical protein IJS78_07580 [Clostridia bacterium]|nr:hypothetical protein [Clostridia bacterium]